MKNRIVINQKNPQIRARGLKDLLREEGVSEEEIKISPGSWDVIGEIALVQFSEKCTTKKEIGECLMKKSQEYAKLIGAKSIELSTAKNNLTAQSLYERIGYIRDNEFYSYSYDI